MALFAEQELPTEPGEVKINISAGNFDFSGDKSQVVFSGGVKISYEDMIIEAPTITAFFSTPDTVDFFVAESSPDSPVILHKDKEMFTSKSLKAYVQKKAYFLYELRGTYKAKNAKGRKQEMIMASEKSRSKPFDEKNITEAHKGYLTTCDEERPHYRFQANYIVVKNSNEIIAYDLLMYIYDIPVLPYPVFFTSLERTAQPVESSFTLTGDSGIQTHLRFNYYSKGDEIGSVFYDTVGDGDKKGNTIGAENKFTLPDGKTSIYFYGKQTSGEDFSNRNSELKFDLARKWDEQFETLFYIRNTQMSVVNNEISSRKSEIGVHLTGKINDSKFDFIVEKKEARNSSSNKNTWTLPSFQMNPMRFKYFEDIYPMNLTFNRISFKANTTTDASVTFNEVLKSLQYTFTPGLSFSASMPEIVIRDVKLIEGFDTKLTYNLKYDDKMKDDFLIDNTFILPKVGFDWEAFFGIHTQYKMKVGYLEDYEDETAYRYGENVSSDLSFKVFFWENKITHDFIFVKSDGNTSRLSEFDKEKNLLSLTSTLNLEALFSKIDLKTSYDFLKEIDQLSNPTVDTTTDFDLLNTGFIFKTNSTIDASSTKLISTKYDFDINNRYFENSLEFLYLYDKDVNVNKLKNTLTLKFGPLLPFKSQRSVFDFTFTHNSEADALKLNKFTNNNTFVFDRMGPIKTLTETLNFTISPQATEEKLDSIKNQVVMKFDDMSLDLATEYKRAKNNINVSFSGSFDQLGITSLTFGTDYDTKQSEFEGLTLGIKKDLHCWENETSVKFELKNTNFELSEFSTNFSLKAFPEKFVKVQPLKKSFDLAIF